MSTFLSAFVTIIGFRDHASTNSIELIFSSRRTSYRHPLSLGSRLIFCDREREFSYQETSARDLYSLLSEALFRSPGKAERIKKELLTRRWRLSYLHHLSPKRKETLRRGRPTEDTVTFGTPVYENGDTAELKLAASIFKFSYTLFGILSGGESWERYLVSTEQEDPKGRLPWLGFICRTKGLNSDIQSNHEWFLLQQSRRLRTERNQYRLCGEEEGEGEGACLLRPIKPVPSQYHSEPSRSTQAALTPQSRSWFSSKHSSIQLFQMQSWRSFFSISIFGIS
jgi:hypothetical protein